MIWPFKRKTLPVPPGLTGPESFADWTPVDIAKVSGAIRARNGQPSSEGFDRIARIALNTMRGAGAVELVARAIETSLNGPEGVDEPIDGSHYMRGMPRWCMWVEYARPAVQHIAGRG